MDSLEALLNQLEEDGVIFFENALMSETSEHFRQSINHARKMG